MYVFFLFCSPAFVHSDSSVHVIFFLVIFQTLFSFIITANAEFSDTSMLLLSLSLPMCVYLLRIYRYRTLQYISSHITCLCSYNFNSVVECRKITYVSTRRKESKRAVLRERQYCEINRTVTAVRYPIPACASVAFVPLYTSSCCCSLSLAFATVQIKCIECYYSNHNIFYLPDRNFIKIHDDEKPSSKNTAKKTANFFFFRLHKFIYKIVVVMVMVLLLLLHQQPIRAVQPLLHIKGTHNQKNDEQI